MVYWVILQESEFQHFIGGVGGGGELVKQTEFLLFFTGPWLQLWKHVVMKMFRSKSHQEINSELNEALVLLKRTKQLEKVPQRPCCV